VKEYCIRPPWREIRSQKSSTCHFYERKMTQKFVNYLNKLFEPQLATGFFKNIYLLRVFIRHLKASPGDSQVAGRGTRHRTKIYFTQRYSLTDAWVRWVIFVQKGVIQVFACKHSVHAPKLLKLYDLINKCNKKVFKKSKFEPNQKKYLGHNLLETCLIKSVKSAINYKTEVYGRCFANVGVIYGHNI